MIFNQKAIAFCAALLLATPLIMKCAPDENSILEKIDQHNQLLRRSSESKIYKTRNAKRFILSLINSITSGAAIGATTGYLCSLVDNNLLARHKIGYPITWFLSTLVAYRARKVAHATAQKHELPFNTDLAWGSSTIASWFTWLYAMGYVG